MKLFGRAISVVICGAMTVALASGCGSVGAGSTGGNAGAASSTAASSQAASGKAEPAAAGTSAANGEKIEIEFWDMVWGPTEYIETASKLVDEYNASQDKVIVKYQSTPWTNWYQTFATAIASGSAPDISTGAGYQAFQFYAVDAIMPIDDVIADMKADGSYADITEGLPEMFQYDGHYIALPCWRDTRVWWYNKAIFKNAGINPPTNWEEMRAAGKAVSHDGTYLLAPGGAMNGGFHMMITMLVNNGGGLFDENKKVVANNERNMETFRYLSDLAASGSFNPASAAFSDDEAQKAFVSGKTAMFLYSPGLDTQYEGLEDQIAQLAPMEGLHGDKGTLNWVNNLMLYNETKYPEETKTFLKWWSLNQKPLFIDGKVTKLPARKSFASDPFFTQDANKMAVINDYLPIAKSFAANYDGLFPELNEIEGDTVLTSAMQGIIMGEDPAEMAQVVQDGVEAIMSKQAK